MKSENPVEAVPDLGYDFMKDFEAEFPEEDQ